MEEWLSNSLGKGFKLPKPGIFAGTSQEYREKAYFNTKPWSLLEVSVLHAEMRNYCLPRTDSKNKMGPQNVRS